MTRWKRNLLSILSKINLHIPLMHHTLLTSFNSIQDQPGFPMNQLYIILLSFNSIQDQQLLPAVLIGEAASVFQFYPRSTRNVIGLFAGHTSSLSILYKINMKLSLVQPISTMRLSILSKINRFEWTVCPLLTLFQFYPRSTYYSGKYNETLPWGLSILSKINININLERILAKV